MQGVAGILRGKMVYFISFVLLLIACIISLLVQGKSGSFLSLNTIHTPPTDEFFTYYTYVGDGLFALAITLLCFFVNKDKQLSLAQLIAYLLSGLLAQIIKALIFAPRPKMYFQPGQYHHFIENVTLSNGSSFPSGHTATAFAMATIFVLMTKSAKWQLPLLLAAGMVGYSRIYLGQHFLLDAFTGAVIGVLSAIVTVMVMDHYAMKKLTPKRVDTKTSQQENI